jgi:hypothetical protein
MTAPPPAGDGGDDGNGGAVLQFLLQDGQVTFRDITERRYFRYGEARKGVAQRRKKETPAGGVAWTTSTTARLAATVVCHDKVCVSLPLPVCRCRCLLPMSSATRSLIRHRRRRRGSRRCGRPVAFGIFDRSWNVSA